MCIRDRINTDSDRDRWFTAEEAKEYGIIDNVIIGKGELASVSYTHLRAHETVLDLVCRLLLEKKNKCHINISLGANTWQTMNIQSSST